LKKVLLIVVVIVLLAPFVWYGVDRESFSEWLDRTGLTATEKSKRERPKRSRDHRRATLILPDGPAEIFVDGRPQNAGSHDYSAGLRHVWAMDQGRFDYQTVDLAERDRVTVQWKLKRVDEAEDWPCFRGDLHRTGLARTHMEAEPELAWQTDLGASVESSPIIVGERIYLTTENALVLALDLGGGERVWSVEGSGSEVGPVCVGEFVVAADHVGKLLAFRASDGAPKGETHLNSYATSLTSIDSDQILVVTRDGRLMLFGSKRSFTGKLKFNLEWENELPGLSGSSASPIVVGQMVVVTTGSSMIALNLRDGSQIWPEKEASPGMQHGELTMSFVEDEGVLTPTPVCDGNSIYCVQGDRLVARTVGDGSLRWQVEQDAKTTSSLALAWGVIFCGAEDGSLYGYSSVNGEELYRSELGRSPILSSPVVLGDRVLVASRSGHLHWVHAFTGEKVGRLDALHGADVTSSPAEATGAIVAANQRGQLALWR